MKPLKKSISSIVLVLLSLITLYSCGTCDCFVAEQIISVKIKTKENIVANTDTSGIFKLEEIDSSYLIRTEKNNRNKHIDTIYFCSTQSFPHGINIHAETLGSFDYILKNDNPPFEHFFTDITTSSELSGHYYNSCRCKTNFKTDFKFDGVQKHIEDLPIVIKKEWFFKETSETS